MGLDRQKVLEESISIQYELADSANLLNKAKMQLDSASKEFNVISGTMQKIEESDRESIKSDCTSREVKVKEREKIKLKYERASERLSMARSSYRQCEEVTKALQQKINQFDLPKLLQHLEGLEAKRSEKVSTTIQNITKLDQMAAEMNLQYTTLMHQKASTIQVSTDQSPIFNCRRFIETEASIEQLKHDSPRYFKSQDKVELKDDSPIYHLIDELPNGFKSASLNMI